LRCYPPRAPRTLLLPHVSSASFSLSCCLFPRCVVCAPARSNQPALARTPCSETRRGVQTGAFEWLESRSEGAGVGLELCTNGGLSSPAAPAVGVLNGTQHTLRSLRTHTHTQTHTRAHTRTRRHTEHTHTQASPGSRAPSEYSTKIDHYYPASVELRVCKSVARRAVQPSVIAEGTGYRCASMRAAHAARFRS
jgi:hypothetical protein